MERTRWYKDMVFYQIWPRSFYDGNGDGMGDLVGVCAKLDYIKSLGVDGIWFSPLYPSPGVDCGYDISDYMDIAEEFGGMDAFKTMLAAAHERGMRVIMDLVINHTSDEHEWFQKSRRRIEPYTDYYIWRPAGKNGKLPNNWDSSFEGKAWQFDELRQEYYLHLYAVKQPDLNMDNPLVREEVKKILRFWLDLGVDGFREDVITLISKKEGLPNDYLFPIYKGIRFYNHGPHLHEYLAEFRRDVLKDYDCVTIAEAPLIWPRRALEYIAEKPDADFDMMIQFACMCADCFFTDYLPTHFSLRKLKRAWSSWQTKLDGRAWNMLYIENHDHPRIISRYGSEQYWKESGKMLAAMYMLQRGTPFIYQGQEIGMLNIALPRIDMYKDVMTMNAVRLASKIMPAKKVLKLVHDRSRENSRTPMQWSNEANAGFSTAAPWFYVNGNYHTINVRDEDADPDSILNFYRELIRFKKNTPAALYGTYRELMPESRELYVYEREYEGKRLMVVCSFTNKLVRFELPERYDLEKAELVLANYEHNFVIANGFTTRPYELRVYLWG